MPACLQACHATGAPDLTQTSPTCLLCLLHCTLTPTTHQHILAVLLQPERLVQRLQAVCAAEGLRCEKSTLRLLVERTDCDVRSCLNTLQVRSIGWHAVWGCDVVGRT